jgi:hypothetical protein
MTGRPRPLRLASSETQPTKEACAQAGEVAGRQRLWPSNKVGSILLEAQISQAFAASRIIDPVARQLRLRGLVSFGDLVGLTRAEIFKDTPKVLRVRAAFVKELENLGFVFSAVPRQVEAWRRPGLLTRPADA